MSPNDYDSEQVEKNVLFFGPWQQGEYPWYEEDEQAFFMSMSYDLRADRFILWNTLGCGTDPEDNYAFRDDEAVITMYWLLGHPFTAVCEPPSSRRRSAEGRRGWRGRAERWRCWCGCSSK